MNDVRYPDITVQLSGKDGNIFMLMGICTAALRRAGISKDEIDQLRSEVMDSEDYGAALRVLMSWVNVI